MPEWGQTEAGLIARLFLNGTGRGPSHLGLKLQILNTITHITHPGLNSHLKHLLRNRFAPYEQ